MREMKKLLARITSPCVIGGSHHLPGDLVSVDSNTYRSLLADDLAVPAAHVVPAAPELKIRPYIEDE